MDAARQELAIRPAGGDTATPRNLSKRLALLERHAGPLVDKRVLDCGCGGGDWVRALSALGADAWGVEVDAAKLSADPHIESGDLEKLRFDDESFDVALLNEVLEHVPDDRRALAEALRVLCPGGVLVVFSPNRLFPFESHGVALRRSGRKLSPATPFVPWIPLRLGRLFFDYWARNYWPWELAGLVGAAGLRVRHRSYVWQTFENVSGRQPRWIRALRPGLRALAAGLESTPGLRAFGISQLLVAVKASR